MSNQSVESEGWIGLFCERGLLYGADFPKQNFGDIVDIGDALMHHSYNNSPNFPPIDNQSPPIIS